MLSDAALGVAAGAATDQQEHAIVGSPELQRQIQAQYDLHSPIELAGLFAI